MPSAALGYVKIFTKRSGDDSKKSHLPVDVSHALVQEVAEMPTQMYVTGRKRGL